jgi:spermidine synthase
MDAASQRTWQQQNRQALHERCQPLVTLTPGLLLDHRGACNRHLVTRTDDEIILTFAEDDASSGTLRQSGAMSRFDPTRPLWLSSAYTQAMCLGLLWTPTPSRIISIGLAGGRLPLVLHHAFPLCRFTSIDIDPDVLPLAQQYFGFVTDERQEVILSDGRSTVTNLAPEDQADVLFVDAYAGCNEHPPHLTTLEFFSICRRHIRPGGALVANLMEHDPQLPHRLRTLQATFAYVVICPAHGNIIAMASDILPEALTRRDPLPAQHLSLKLELLPLAEWQMQCQLVRDDTGNIIYDPA